MGYEKIKKQEKQNSQEEKETYKEIEDNNIKEKT